MYKRKKLIKRVIWILQVEKMQKFFGGRSMRSNVIIVANYFFFGFFFSITLKARPVASGSWSKTKGAVIWLNLVSRCFTSYCELPNAGQRPRVIVLGGTGTPYGVMGRLQHNRPPNVWWTSGSIYMMYSIQYRNRVELPAVFLCITVVRLKP